MRFLAIGAERIELNYLEKILHDSIPDCDLICFEEPSEALEYIAGTQRDSFISRNDKKSRKKSRKKFRFPALGNSRYITTESRYICLLKKPMN